MKKAITIILAVIMAFSIAACGRNQNDSDKKESTKDFPSFKGYDLEGNTVDSSVFSKNDVTVVNFWFNTCPACIEELKELSQLNEKLKEQNGEVIGINTDTFDGSEKAVAETKKILKEKDAAYTNIWVARDSKLADFSLTLQGYPTTYVVDKNGKIVGDPILGGINEPAVMDMLKERIDRL